jgi:hypothetical protein
MRLPGDLIRVSLAIFTDQVALLCLSGKSSWPHGGIMKTKVKLLKVVNF